jgi:2,3-bisphosphoglycerate-independent phosphoglycerate mutase
MDALAKKSVCGTVLNVPEGMVPESDTANLAIMSYDPRKYSKGRSPLEAVSLGIKLEDDDTARSCNRVTLSEDTDVYEERTMLDHSADEISTEEADELIRALDESLKLNGRKLYTGISYRHCLIWKGANAKYNFDRPHDIIGEKIASHLPSAENGGEAFLEFMKKGAEILKDHPVNVRRRAAGKNPANSPWLWSPGQNPSLPSFGEKWGLKASVISAVDLIKGIAICAGMRSVDVEGATGNISTNFAGKGQAAIEEFKNGQDYVYIHVEAPDECGHRGETENKVLSVEQIDAKILAPVFEYLKGCGEDFRILVLPDHPTPICKRTHTMDAVPFFIYDSTRSVKGADVYCEDTAKASGLYLEKGEMLMDLFIGGAAK